MLGMKQDKNVRNLGEKSFSKHSLGMKSVGSHSNAKEHLFGSGKYEDRSEGLFNDWNNKDTQNEPIKKYTK